MSDTPGPSFAFTPTGVLLCRRATLPCAVAFTRSEPAGLLHLGGHPAPPDADAPCLFWKGLADTLLRRLCHQGDDAPLSPDDLLPEPTFFAEAALDAPPMPGAEYISPGSLRALLFRLASQIVDSVGAHTGGLAAFLAEQAPAWSRVGRVTLHLAENKNDPECPFAFMATYATGLTSSGRLTQLPLAKALAEYGGTNNKPALLNLLRPLHNASSRCPLLRELVESSDIFHPLAWSPDEALTFLRNIPLYEDSGLSVRLPNWWRKRPSRPKVRASIGSSKPAGLGLNALLDFHLSVVVDGRELSNAELSQLLASPSDGLVLFRGEWIEIDRQQLQQALDHWQSLAKSGGISFLDGMRLLAGLSNTPTSTDPADPDHLWAFAEPGPELAALLRQLASPDPLPPPASLRATLRPYQARGLDWLWFCARTGLGACLADDMGLGKTIQVLAALLRKKEAHPDSPPCLLVVPASLLGNWRREAERFAPSLRLHIAHPSGHGTLSPDLASLDLVLITYGLLHRLDWPDKTHWDWVILDEAQAVKNHASRQSRAVRSLRASSRLALTGTPIENSLADLWSLFDFLNPGLLGPAKTFSDHVKRLQSGDHAHFAPLRRLVSPYILRRMKTDKAIVQDLPEKTEMRVFCSLSPHQARLYAHTADELARALQSSDGFQRRGLVLAYLMRFKQICNHPDQLAPSGAFDPTHSGKFLRLIDLCEEIASRGEKVLVFTQFRELTDPLESCLSRVFGQRGFILHGGTPVRNRTHLVDRFQREDGPPFFILSLKAGGTGLTLTAASHVIHFDRWWNPAVENQATDRAFRIGQKRNVLVHKFVTSGTLEEKIDTLLADKQEVADTLLGEGPEKALTEMSDSELLDFIRLDLRQLEPSP